MVVVVTISQLSVCWINCTGHIADTTTIRKALSEDRNGIDGGGGMDLEDIHEEIGGSKTNSYITYLLLPPLIIS